MLQPTRPGSPRCFAAAEQVGDGSAAAIGQPRWDAADARPASSWPALRLEGLLDPR